MLSHYGQWWGWSVLGGDNLTILQYSTLGVPIISQCPRHTPVCPCVSAPVFMNWSKYPIYYDNPPSLAHSPGLADTQMEGFIS